MGEGRGGRRGQEVKWEVHHTLVTLTVVLFRPGGVEAIARGRGSGEAKVASLDFPAVTAPPELGKGTEDLVWFSVRILFTTFSRVS